MLKTAVITISDRASDGRYEDQSGPEIRAILKEAFPDITLDGCIVPDDADAIRGALKQFADCDWIITTGGTGIGPRDITPDITAGYCDHLLPGIAEILRSESYKETPQAMLSRGTAGIRGQTLIVNMPGSLKAVRLCTRLLLPIMPHALDMLKGEGH
ncbi:molybdenum cofactor biosynthesis protein B [Planctomycetota bacterium]